MILHAVGARTPEAVWKLHAVDGPCMQLVHAYPKVSGTCMQSSRCMGDSCTKKTNLAENTWKVSGSCRESVHACLKVSGSCRQLAGELGEALQPFTKKTNLAENMKRTICKAQKGVEDAGDRVKQAVAQGTRSLRDLLIVNAMLSVLPDPDATPPRPPFLSFWPSLHDLIVQVLVGLPAPEVQ